MRPTSGGVWARQLIEAQVIAGESGSAHLTGRSGTKSDRKGSGFAFLWDKPHSQVDNHAYRSEVGKLRGANRQHDCAQELGLDISIKRSLVRAPCGLWLCAGSSFF